MDDFCAREVEPVGKECEELQIMALMRALGVRVHIEYLDGRPLPEGGHLPVHILPEGGGREGGGRDGGVAVPARALRRIGGVRIEGGGGRGHVETKM